MKSQITIFSRTIKRNKTCRKAFYARFWDLDENKIACTVSIDKLYYLLGNRTNEHIKSRSIAMKIAYEAFNAGIVKITAGPKVLFSEYALSLWDFENSDYIKRKNREKAGSISRIYAGSQLGWLKNHVIPNIPCNLELKDFNAPIAERIKDKMLDSGMASSSINKVLQSIRTPLAEAYRTGLIQQNVADKIKNVSLSNKEKGILSPDERTLLEDELRKQFSKSNEGRMKFLVIALAIHTGLREGEIRALHVNDIELNQDPPYILVRHAYNDKDKLKAPKGKMKRIVTLPYNLAKELVEFSECSSQYFLFHSLKKKDVPISPQLIAKWFNEALVAINISEEEQKKRNLTFHSLRHGYITATRDAKMNDFDRQLLAGHKSQAMTEHYTKETYMHMKQMAELIESVIPYRY